MRAAVGDVPHRWPTQPSEWCTSSVANETAHRRRLADRQRGLSRYPEPTWDDVERRRSETEPWAEDHLVVDSLAPLATNVDTCLRYLGWLTATNRRTLRTSRPHFESRILLAMRAASARLRTPSLRMRLLTWTLAVLGEMKSASPISRLVRPSARRPKTSASRSVRTEVSSSSRAGSVERGAP